MRHMGGFMSPAEFLREYETSGRSGGVENTLRLIDDKAIYWFSDGTAHVGKAAVERAIRRNFELIKDETYRISDVVWVAQSRDVAACVYRFDWSGLLSGQPASGSGRGTCVLARRGDSWVVVHEHLSKGQPAA
jgi:ketosteroid isomerase-like protein